MIFAASENKYNGNELVYECTLVYSSLKKMKINVNCIAKCNENKSI